MEHPPRLTRSFKCARGILPDEQKTPRSRVLCDENPHARRVAGDLVRRLVQSEATSVDKPAHPRDTLRSSATLAQLVERSFRKAQVAGSSPAGGFSESFRPLRTPEGLQGGPKAQFASSLQDPARWG